MRSHPTLSEIAWPMDAESRQQAREWAGAAAFQVLDWTWRGFDALQRNVLRHVDLQQPLEQLERNLVALHYIEIQRVFRADNDGFSSIEPHHEYPELETRSPAPAKPPAYDIAFVWSVNPRATWPIEAKVLPSPNRLAEYLGDVEKFTSGIAAPLTGEGAQIAYLLVGTSDAFFANLSQRLSSPLLTIPVFANRPHRSSMLVRSVAPELRLHHMAMVCCSETGYLSGT